MSDCGRPGAAYNPALRGVSCQPLSLAAGTLPGVVGGQAMDK